MIAGIDEILHDIAHGRMIVLVDDEERENEGDLLMAARFVSAEAVNFMSQHGRGLVCLTLDEAHCRRLDLPLMTANNQSAYSTNFTVSIEAASGVTTGISAADRAHTILTASNPNVRAEEVVRPGHIFPIRAEKGGVLVRAGHTEAGCDLTAMAGLYPAAVICEVMNADGSMARLPELVKFAEKHGLKVGTIKSLIEHRLKNEQLIERLSERVVETVFGEFNLTVYRDTINRDVHLALHKGEIVADRAVMTRVTTHPTVLESLAVAQMPAAWGVAAALRAIAAEETGVLLLLSAAAADEEKLLRQSGVAEAAVPPKGVNLRHYGLGAQMLRDLGVGKIRLLSGRMRLPSMDGFGLAVEEIVEP